MTGDFFIDSGRIALSLLDDKTGNRKNSIEFLVDLYLGRWNKAMFNFFPNSPFTSPTQKNKRDAAMKIYTRLAAPATRDKVILSYSNSSVNYTPSMMGSEASLEVLQAHLAVPVACRVFKDGLFALIMSNNELIMQKYISEGLLKNLKSDKPFFEEDYFEPFARNFLQQNGGKEDCLNFILFNNYIQNPVCRVGNLEYFE